MYCNNIPSGKCFTYIKLYISSQEPSPLLMKQNAEDNLFVETEDSLGAEPEASNDGMSVSNDVPSPAPTKSHKKVAQKILKYILKIIDILPWQHFVLCCIANSFVRFLQNGLNRKKLMSYKQEKQGIYCYI